MGITLWILWITPGLILQKDIFPVDNRVKKADFRRNVTGIRLISMGAHRLFYRRIFFFFVE